MYTSLHGTRFGYDENGLLFDGARVGIDEKGIGKTYYVNSATAGSDGTSASTAVATLAAALAKCTANQGDKVVLMEGHAETITAATALTPAGVRIIGLGKGNKRPTITFTTSAAAGFTCAVANVSFENIIFVGNVLSIVSCFTLTTAPEFGVERCEFRDTDATHGFLSIITTTVSVNSDGLRFIGNRVQSDATTTPGPTIVIANTIDRVTITDNFIVHSTISNNIAALLEHGALVVTHLLCLGNFVYSVNTDTATGAILVKTTAITGTGIIAHNRIRALDVAAAIVVTAAAVQYGLFDNLYTGDVAFSGFVLPAIASD